MQLPPGYRLRAPVIEDGPAIADMLNTETGALTGVPLASLEWVTTAWTALRLGCSFWNSSGAG